MSLPSNEEILESALESWLWSCAPSFGNGFDEDRIEEMEDSFDGMDQVAEEFDAQVDSSARAQWSADIEKFMDEAEPVFEELESRNIPIKDIGHDIALTRNGHGAGFWDRGYPEELGEKLTEIAKSLGEYSAFIHVSPAGQNVISGE